MASNDSQGRIAAVLGPTNTGKTRYAIERMLGHHDGMIGLPLRLLAREVYDKIVREKGQKAAALITGEERIAPETARYFVCTVEAMPLERRTAFLAVDEIQLCADADRGHVFTQRLLHARGLHETLFLGADTMRAMIRRHVPEAEIIYRERLSTLSYAGPRKLTKLPRRTAIVAFSANEVYAIAELIRRQRGGAAVVMGALSPRTRNAQVELYQSGEVDFLVATDAIGMGLNMDVDHVAFASRQKFDGRRSRPLRAAEIAQIAGRAGRYRTDGTFGESGDCPLLEQETVARITEHAFEPEVAVEWRNADLAFDTVPGLIASLEQPPEVAGLSRVRDATDELTLKRLTDDQDLMDRAKGQANVRRLWDACLMPDFRKVTIDEHARLVGRIAGYLLSRSGRIPSDWAHREVDHLDRMDGDLDALQSRVAHIRTWTYAANRADWLQDAPALREQTRMVEDKLSDALHAALAQRFIDRRTSALMRGLKREDIADAHVDEAGAVKVEGHFVGRLIGLEFKPDPAALGREGRAVRNAAERALGAEVTRRLWAVAKAQRLTLSRDARLRVEGVAMAALLPGPDPLKPRLRLLGGIQGDPRAQAAAKDHLTAWLKQHIESRLRPLTDLVRAQNDKDLSSAARGLAFRLLEGAGAVDRPGVEELLVGLTKSDRDIMRRIGVRVGRLTVFVPALAQGPASALWCQLRDLNQPGENPPWQPPRTGSARRGAPARPWQDYAARGFRPIGEWIVAIDRLERFANGAFAAIDAKASVDPAALAKAAGLAESMGEPLLRAIGFRQASSPDPAAERQWKGPKRSPPKHRATANPARSQSSPFAALSQLFAVPAGDEP
ncbi:MAG: helicase-related protein [Caulobacterales bacterium]